MKSIFPEDLVNHKHQEITLSKTTVCLVTGWAADKLLLLLCVNIACYSQVYTKLSACSHITSFLLTHCEVSRSGEELQSRHKKTSQRDLCKTNYTTSCTGA